MDLVVLNLVVGGGGGVFALLKLSFATPLYLGLKCGLEAFACLRERVTRWWRLQPHDCRGLDQLVSAELGFEALNCPHRFARLVLTAAAFLEATGAEHTPDSLNCGAIPLHFLAEHRVVRCRRPDGEAHCHRRRRRFRRGGLFVLGRRGHGTPLTPHGCTGAKSRRALRGRLEVCSADFSLVACFAFLAQVGGNPVAVRTFNVDVCSVVVGPTTDTAGGAAIGYPLFDDHLTHASAHTESLWLMRWAREGRVERVPCDFDMTALLRVERG